MSTRITGDDLSAVWDEAMDKWQGCTDCLTYLQMLEARKFQCDDEGTSCDHTMPMEHVITFANNMAHLTSHGMPAPRGIIDGTASDEERAKWPAHEALYTKVLALFGIQEAPKATVVIVYGASGN